MSRGAYLTHDEIEEARRIREEWGLSWRDIGKMLRRDHAGLKRAVERRPTYQQSACNIHNIARLF